MKKYTEGPWDQEEGLKIFAQGKKGVFNVADVRGWGYFTGKGHGALGLNEDEAVQIQTANAHLIAAAPEMLEALEAMLEATELINTGIRLEEAEQKTILAIKKAKGETE